ncbi:hypothetical protein GCM10010869_15470 [Mesorhizobium tianshanense]|nr:hypothetical protein GCM10010869_15470 [Mesorhizobium tianshanense]
MKNHAWKVLVFDLLREKIKKGENLGSWKELADPGKDLLPSAKIRAPVMHDGDARVAVDGCKWRLADGSHMFGIMANHGGCFRLSHMAHALPSRNVGTFREFCFCPDAQRLCVVRPVQTSCLSG